MSRSVQDADRRLEAALEAVRAIDRDEVPAEIAAEVERATLELWSAKGRCEVTKSEVSN
ncbi:MAG: hypothetical protein RI568_15220 [Natronomonas sp.]|uniref:hypothetical protein n=1 Tax=Natronomonas sp. TaxID=2184060 RepID=UPI00286FC25D|nr:hypothetical protein [Natronomonas sp.]MDR9432031.1 hypothetical protein [Natronomonas sp.]